MSAFEVNFYYKADGSCPVRDFLDTLDDKMLAKLLGAISLLETNGTQLREPYSKSLGDGIFELRAKQSSNITRILYFFVVGHQIILTMALSKRRKKHRRRKLHWRKSIVRTIFIERRVPHE